MPFFRGLLLSMKKLFSSADAERRKKEKNCYLQNGRCVLEELLALCDGNCRIPIRYFSAIEINNAIKHSKTTIMELDSVNMVTGSLDNRPVLVRFNTRKVSNIHRDIAITAQMSHLKNVLRLVGCCLEFEQPVMVYQYVEARSLLDLLFNKGNINDQTRKSLLSWGNRLRIANEVASAIVFLHTEFTTPIINRYINPSNVIIDQNSGVAKIVDFSLSISLPPGKLELQEDIVSGIVGYIAPEYHRTLIVTQKIDVYSFGILLFLLITGKEVRDILNSRVDSINSKESIHFEVDAKSNTEEGNTLDRVNYAILEEIIDFKIFPTNLINHYIKESNVLDIVEPTIFEEHGIEIQQQLKDYLDLAKKCTSDNGDDRPYMIHVARELGRIEKCFHALTISQN